MNQKTETVTEKGKPVKCRNCGKEWNYTGSSDFYITCPRCRLLSKIEKAMELRKLESQSKA